MRLLLGEVPDRAEFSVPGLSRPLRPYFELTQAVRSGDLVAFAQVRVGACVCASEGTQTRALQRVHRHEGAFSQCLPHAHTRHASLALRAFEDRHFSSNIE